MGPGLLLMTNRKSHTRFRLEPKSTTLDDLEGHCFKIHASFGAHHENLNEDIGLPIHYQRRGCSPMTLDSGNIRNMRIFAVVPWRRGVKQQWVIENVDFQVFRTLRLRHLRKWGQYYYIVLFSPLSPFHWQQNTWPWMATLHTQFSIFTIMNSVSARRLHIYRRATYRTFLLYDVTSTDLRKRTVKTVIRSILRSRERIADLSILSSTKSCGRYAVGTLTIKANMS